MTRDLGCLFLLFVNFSSFAAEPPQITAKTLEYQDKVQDFDLELINARTNLTNAVLELELAKDICEHTTKLVGKGYEPSTQKDGCDAAVIAAQTKLTELTKGCFL